MREERLLPIQKGGRRLFISIGVAVLMLIVLFQSISANQDGPFDISADLSGSNKSVNLDQASIDDTLRYSIALRNDGGQVASEVVMEDLLPEGLDYVANSLEVLPAIGLYGESDGLITWTGALNVSQEIILNYEATVSSDITNEVTIVNTAIISAAGVAIDRSAQTTILSDTTSYIFLPLLFMPAPNMNLTLLDGPDSNNHWTIGFWPDRLLGVTGYEIEEAQDPSFHGAVLIQVGDPGINTLERIKDPSPSSTYYYRARSIAGSVAGAWSSVVSVAGNYYDDFNSSDTGWRTVRQDTDDIDQSSYYSSGNYVHRQHGRWDYLISSPLIEAPGENYTIETYARFVGQDNLHTLGVVFDGDWDGTACPNSKYTSCFNHYYRLLAIWYGSPDRLRIQLKRIDEHDPGSNAGRGVTLVDWKDVRVTKPPETWQKWTIERYQDGLIRVLVNGNQIASTTDTTYYGNRYFGGFSATNEYAGLDVRFDWFEAKSMD